jgi:hypothetical protein
MPKVARLEKKFEKFIAPEGVINHCGLRRGLILRMNLR